MPEQDIAPVLAAWISTAKCGNINFRLATSNVFRKGHILRLEISSSNFPRFDRNLNSGADAAFAHNYVPATNAIYPDDQHPSALILPIVQP